LSKLAISTPLAPAAIGPYSQAVRSGNLVFLSGQIPLDPETDSLWKGRRRANRARAAKPLSDSGGRGLKPGASVETTVYLRDISDFAIMNEVYARFFGDCPPARATVEVARLPRNVAVEIDLIAEVEG